MHVLHVSPIVAIVALLASCNTVIFLVIVKTDTTSVVSPPLFEQMNAPSQLHHR